MSKNAGRIALGLVIAAALDNTALAAEYRLSGTFSFVSEGNTYTIEDGHFFFTGRFSGAYRDDSGAGPFAMGIQDCPGWNDVGRNAGGYCIFRDADGDLAFNSWSCSGVREPPPGVMLAMNCSGQWAGGTGKFSGITSAVNPYRSFVINVFPDGSSAGFAVWDHVATIPD